MYVCKVHPELCFCLMKSLCYYCPTFLIQVFSPTAIVLLCYASSSIFSNHSINSDHSRLCQTIAFAQRMFVVNHTSPCFSSLNHLHNYRSSSSDSSSSSKTTALHTTTLTAWLVLIVCFFSLAIIQELSHDCSRANGEPREYLQRLSVKRDSLDVPWQDFGGSVPLVLNRKMGVQVQVIQ